VRKESVNPVSVLGGGEWRPLSHDCEQDDAEGEHVNLATLVVEAGVDLRCHVVLRTELGVQEACGVVASNLGTEPEVHDLELELVIQEDVLQLQVSVRYTSGVHVLDCADQLAHGEPGCLLFKWCCFSDEIEEVSLGGQVSGNVPDGSLAAGMIFHDSITKGNHLEDVIMLQALHGSDFLLLVWKLSWIVGLIYLHGDLGVRGHVECLVHVGGSSTAEFSQDVESVVDGDLSLSLCVSVHLLGV